jgi:hypothetical protein
MRRSAAITSTRICGWIANVVDVAWELGLLAARAACRGRARNFLFHTSPLDFSPAFHDSLMAMAMPMPMAVPVRRHGLERPLSSHQVGAILIVVVSLIIYWALAVPFCPPEWRSWVLAPQLGLFLVTLLAWVRLVLSVSPSAPPLVVASESSAAAAAAAAAASAVSTTSPADISIVVPSGSSAAARACPVCHLVKEPVC